jgi:hypothetical protein
MAQSATTATSSDVKFMQAQSTTTATSSDVKSTQAAVNGTADPDGAREDSDFETDCYADIQFFKSGVDQTGVIKSDAKTLIAVAAPIGTHVAEVSVDIRGVDKNKLLKALWSAQKTIHYSGLHGFKDATQSQLMHPIQYHCGRCIKSDLSGDSADPWGYDRDEGAGMFQKIVTQLRQNPECVVAAVTKGLCMGCKQVRTNETFRLSPNGRPLCPGCYELFGSII